MGYPDHPIMVQRQMRQFLWNNHLGLGAICSMFRSLPWILEEDYLPIHSQWPFTLCAFVADLEDHQDCCIFFRRRIPINFPGKWVGWDSQRMASYPLQCPTKPPQPVFTFSWRAWHGAKDKNHDLANYHRNLGVCHFITWNNPKKLEKPWITKGLATWQSLGLILSCNGWCLWWTPNLGQPY